MPVRKIPRNGGSITGRVAHYGTAKSVGHESFLEHDFVFLALFDPEVAEVEEQPVRITYEEADAAKRRREQLCFPDYLVTYHAWTRRAPMLVEVKYCAHLETERAELLPKIRAGRCYARQQGWRYRVYTERYVRTSLLPNIKFLLPYRRFPRDAARCQRLLEALTHLGRAQASQLLDACSKDGTEDRGKYIACLWWLMSAREITADLAAPLSMSTPLWPKESPLGR